MMCLYTQEVVWVEVMKFGMDCFIQSGNSKFGLQERDWHTKLALPEMSPWDQEAR